MPRPRPGERPLSGLELVPAPDAATWDAAVLAADLGTPFHAWDFLDGYAASAGQAFDPLLVLRDGTPIGGVPRVVRRLGPLRWVNAGLSFSYAGPAVPAGDLVELLAELGHVGPLRRLTTMRERYEVRVPPEALQAPGWTTRADSSMVVTVGGRTEAELRSAASKKFRQHLGHAARGGLVVEPATETDLAEALPGWVGARFHAQGLATPFPAELVLRVCATFRERDALHASAARVDGRTVGVQVALGLGARTYPWLIGSSPDHEHLRVPTALSWELIAWAREAGLAEVDLSGTPNKGIRDFKRAMGAEPRDHAVLERGVRT